MKTYGDIETEGQGKFKNLTIDNGDDFPSASEGELFYINSESKGYTIGLYYNDGTRWVQIVNSATLATAVTSNTGISETNGVKSFGSQVKGVTPVESGDLVTKSYVDTTLAGKASTADLLTETTARQAADTTLQNNINAETTARQTAVALKYDASNPSGYQTAAQVATSLQSIIGTAPAALNTLKELADALGNDADYASTVTTALSTKATTAYVNSQDAIETTARQVADTTLQNNINAETTARTDADTTNSIAIAVETTARVDADALLSLGLDAETTARTDADNVLRSYLDKEVFDLAHTLLYWLPIRNSSAYSVMGLASPSTTGTAVARSIGTTDMYAASKRVAYSSANGAGSSCGLRLATQQFFRGSAVGVGGFKIAMRFGIGDIATAIPTARMFVGLTGAAAIGNVNPSTLTNIIGIGTDAGQTTFRIMYNDASGVASTIDLGASFPANTVNTDLYELVLYCASGSPSITYTVTILNTGVTVTGTLSTNIPAASQVLAPQYWRNNGSGTGVVIIDFASLIATTEY